MSPTFDVRSRALPATVRRPARRPVRRPARRPAWAPPLLLVLLAAILAACGPAAPAGSFAATGPCDGSGRAAGTYKDLEALLPTGYQGEAPDSMDSGRSCTTDALGVLADRGVSDMRYAGTTWDLGMGRGLTVAVFEGDAVTPEAMIAFYEEGARKARRTERLATSDTTVAGRPARRLDVLWGSSAQSIVAWPDAQGARTFVLLAADLGDAAVLEALERLGDR